MRLIDVALNYSRVCIGGCLSTVYYNSVILTYGRKADVVDGYGGGGTVRGLQFAVITCNNEQ